MSKGLKSLAKIACTGPLNGEERKVGVMAGIKGNATRFARPLRAPRT
jgi:hypothetical protein